MSLDQNLSSYDYKLPPDYIAQSPAVPRDHSRLLVINGPDTVEHRHFYDLPNYLQAGDLLVLNDTKVMPARLHGHKENGVAMEILLLTECNETQWIALVKPGKRLPPGVKIKFASLDGNKPELWATILDRDEETGGRLLQFELPKGQRLWEVLPDYGEIPFPPYVSDRQATADQYQTIYAEKLGAVAAPRRGSISPRSCWKNWQPRALKPLKLPSMWALAHFAQWKQKTSLTTPCIKNGLTYQWKLSRPLKRPGLGEGGFLP